MLSYIFGDDFGDFFIVDEKLQKKKGWVDEIFERKDVEDIEDEDNEFFDDLGDNEDDEGGIEEEDNDEKFEILKDWEQSDDDVSEEEDELDEREGGEDDGIYIKFDNKKNEMVVNKKKVIVLDLVKGKGGVKQFLSVRQDFFFKIDVFSNMDELYILFGGRFNEDIIEVIRRIRVCNVIVFVVENRKKI